MKIRIGFVSNSSSSSYIVAVAHIKNKKKFDDWIASFEESGNSILDSYSVRVCSIKDIKEKEQWSIKYREDNIIAVDSFQDYVLLDAEKLSDDDEIFIVDITNDEGDSEFSVYADDGEWLDLNYDIDLSFFSKKQRRLFEEMSGFNGLDKISKSFGAGRNG